MATKMKGIYKGFKFISQIFVVKEREMEIGYPTDVKHVAHIGWDGNSASAPSWMSEFKTSSDFSAVSPCNACETRSPSRWRSQDFEHSVGYQPVSEICQDIPPKEHSKALGRKHKRKKTKSSSSLCSPSKDSSTTSSRSSSRTSKSKAAYMAKVTRAEALTPNLQGVSSH